MSTCRPGWQGPKTVATPIVSMEVTYTWNLSLLLGGKVSHTDFHDNIWVGLLTNAKVHQQGGIVIFTAV